MNKATKTILEVYRRAYREADPPADFDKLTESGATQKEGWFNDYYLPMDRLIEIFDEVCKELKISKYEKESMKFELYLGGLPNSNKNGKS
jgi:hypothetical protein